MKIKINMKINFVLSYKLPPLSVFVLLNNIYILTSKLFCVFIITEFNFKKEARDA